MSISKLTKYHQFIANAENAGCNLLEFKTPCCDRHLKTMAPETVGAMWDSLVICPHCSQPFLKEVYVDRVVVQRLDHPSTNLKTA